MQLSWSHVPEVLKYTYERSHYSHSGSSSDIHEFFYFYISSLIPSRDIIWYI